MTRSPFAIPTPLRRIAVAAAMILIVLAAGACADPGVLYEQRSAFSDIIVTQEADGSRTLQFERGGARQSVGKPDDPDYLAFPYARTALAALALCERPRRILIVGLGGATLPRFLHRHYPEAAIDVVEIDPDVVKVATQFFGFRQDDRLRAHVADGRAFVEAVRVPYDLVVLDAYGASSVPRHLATVEFLRAVRRAVRTDGVVAGNVWGSGYNPLYGAMVRSYQQVFATVTVLPAAGSGNRIVLALPRKEDVSTTAVAARAARVSRRDGLPLDLGATVGALAADEWATIDAATPLHDPDETPATR